MGPSRAANSRRAPVREGVEELWEWKEGEERGEVRWLCDVGFMVMCLTKVRWLCHMSSTAMCLIKTLFIVTVLPIQSKTTFINLRRVK